jgi:hypothetical protein
MSNIVAALLEYASAAGVLKLACGAAAHSTARTDIMTSYLRGGEAVYIKSVRADMFHVSRCRDS